MLLGALFRREKSQANIASRARNISVAIVDDSLEDFHLIKHLLEKSGLKIREIAHYSRLEAILEEQDFSPDVVLLDRCLPDCGLSEPHIRQIRAKHNNCGVILHTGNMTPSLRSTSAHEGAVAVIEKGTLDACAIGTIVSAAAECGPSLHLN